MSRRVAWGAVALAATAIAAGFALREPTAATGFLLPIAIPFVGVGALLALKRARNPIGWLFLGFGLVASLDFAAQQYAARSLAERPVPPSADVAASIAAHLWHPFFGLFVFAFLLFPDGRLVSPRWRWVARATVVTYVGLAVTAPLDTSYVGSDFPGAEPVVSGPASEAATALYAGFLTFNLVLLPLAGASLVVRLRRSQGRTRRQVRLFAFTVAAVMFAFPVILLATGFAYGVALFPLIPIAAGVAILRHRLYDLDVVVNRTLVYGALTATLAGVYLGTVLLLTLVLEPVTSGSGLAVAASTLATASVFRPARSRIQAGVDRRFYRRRYDAARILASFGSRLRDEVDVDAVGGELRAAVLRTVEPAHLTLWLPATAAGGRRNDSGTDAP